MRTRRFSLAGAATLAFCLSVVAPWALADSTCEPKDYAESRAHLERAKEAEKAGRSRTAVDEANQSMASECSTAGIRAEALPLIERVRQKEGRAREREGRLKEALEWLDNGSDRDRVMIKWVKSEPADFSRFKSAWTYFTDRGSVGDRDVTAQLQELRQLAGKNSNDALGREAKAFASGEVGVRELDNARTWLGVVGADLRPVTQRANERGDQLAKDDAVGVLERAMGYYKFAENRAREQQLRQRAATLAEAAARKGETAAAERYYRLAGRGDQAEKLSAETAAAQAKAEGKRRQGFEKDQKSLEKELGL